MTDDDEHQYYASNDRRFKGVTKVLKTKVSNFEKAVKEDKVTVEIWNDKVVQR